MYTAAKKPAAAAADWFSFISAGCCWPGRRCAPSAGVAAPVLTLNITQLPPCPACLPACRYSNNIGGRERVRASGGQEISQDIDIILVPGLAVRSVDFSSLYFRIFAVDARIMFSQL